MGTVVLVVGTAGIVLASGLLAACLRLRSIVGFLLATYLFASAEVVVSALLLSTGRWLDRDALLVAIAGVLGVALAVWLRLGRPRPPLEADSTGRLRTILSDPVVATLGALAVVTHAYLLAGALTVPQSTVDTLLYHLPKAALWKQQHAVAYVENAPDESINVFPPNAEIEVSASMILSGGDRYVTIAQLGALACTCVAIFGIARRLGLDGQQAAFGALLFSTYTLVALQTPTALNDLVVASLLISCAYFAMAASRVELVLAALALALALGTKLTAVFALPALALFALSSQPRRRWPTLVLIGVVGTVAGSFWLVVNLAQTGRLDGGVGLDSGADSKAERIWLYLLDLLELSDAEGKGHLAPLLWGSGALVLAAVVAVVLVVRRQSRVGGVALLVGAMAFLAVPMLSIWVQVADRAFGQVRAAVGLTAAASGARAPDELYESPMHSSYGLAFVLLLLGAGAIVTVDVARRARSVAALAALGCVPLTFVVSALALPYDPQRMRYIVFPVALASALFGVAVRIRPLAWTAVALTAVTLTVSLGYFAPRPAGLALLPGNQGTDRTARWLVQGESGGSTADLEAFRFLELEVPANATIALAVERNTYLYPVWDEGLERTVLFAPQNGTIPQDAEWLVVGPDRNLDVGPPSESGWRPALATTGGWRVFSRTIDEN